MQSVAGVAPARRAGARRIRFAPLILASTLFFMFTPAAFSDFVGAGFSESYGLSANLTLTLLSGANVQAIVSPQPDAAGNAPTIYSVDAPLASLNVTAGSFALGTGTVLGVQSGLLDSTANSDIDGTPGGHSAAATSTVHNLDTTILTTSALLNGLVHVTATTITATSNAGGLPLSTLGSTVVENLAISVLGVNVLATTGSIAPNTGVDVSGLIGGVSILLNEQIASGNGVNSLGLTTNAIDIRFTDVGVAGVGTLNGDLIVAHTFASVDSVPEPGSIALASIAAAGGLVVHRVRRRKAKPAPV
jgi:hypothetical protein